MAITAVDSVSPSLTEASGSTIASHVSICLRSFDDFHSHVRSPQSQDSGQVELSEVTDELGRFRIWAGNIGAHRKGRSSLDYRLRDASHIKKKVQTLLEDLNDVISRAIQIIRGERIPWDKRKTEPDSDSDVTDSESEDEYSQGETELRQLMISVHDTITFLLRLSMAIRNPAPHDQYMNSARIDTSHFEGFDVKHVGDKFPKISERVAVILGKAISRRREYFRYRESHNKKLSDGLVTEVPEVVLQSGQSAAPEANQDGKTEIVPQSTVASSIPQEVKADSFYLDLEEDQQSESGFTQTSFATSAGGFQELKVPPMPKEARDGNPFPCPFCFMIISVGSRRSWKKHVFKDLQPYTCTFPSCSSPHRLFERRHEWFQHELQLHRRVWHCIEGCQGQFNSQTDFEIHIKGSHPHFDTVDKLQHMVTVCVRKPSMDSKTNCSFCDREDICVGDLEKHLGKHQEQLALFALPTISSDEGIDDHGSDAEDAGSAKSIHSVRARLSNGFADDESISESGSESEIPEDQRRGSRDFVAPNSCPHFQSGSYVGSFRQCMTCLGWICNDCLESGPICACAYCSTHYHCSICFFKPEVQAHCALDEESKAVRVKESAERRMSANDINASTNPAPELESNIFPRSESPTGLGESNTQTDFARIAPSVEIPTSGESLGGPDKSSKSAAITPSYTSTQYDIAKVANGLQGKQGIPIISQRGQSNIQSNCFTGNDLTKWILDTFQDINTREEAVNLGNKLMNEGLFDRFSGKHPFEDRDLIYRISRDYQVSQPKARLPSISDVPELKEELSEAGEQLAAPPAGRSDGDWVIECNVCDGPIFNEHYHCSLCDQGDYDICTTCIMNGHHCLSESHVLTKRLVEDGKAISSSGEVHSCRDDGRKGSTRPEPQSRFNFESAGHPHTLTELYSDTKQDIKQAKLVNVPEMNALHRRLQIQRDRFIAWCLEWSDDNSAVSQGTIDNFIAPVGPTETVTSVIITIQDIIQQVDRIHASGDLGTLDAKGERNWASCTPAAKALYEDLAQDLTTSVDTLYDLSGARRDYDPSRAGPANEERFGTSHGDGRPADHESRSSVTSLSQLNTSAAEDEYIPESSTREREADIPEKAPPPFETTANSESTDIEIPGTEVEADVEGDLGDLGSFASSSRQSPRPRSPAIHTSTASNPDVETTAPSTSSTGGSASRTQHPSTLPTATKPANKRYIVTRKHSMSLISSSTSVLVFRDECLDIVPSKKLNSNEPSIQKTISAHFSEVIGSKVTSKHPRSFKVVMYRGQRSKAYDFEANSVEEAAEIVKMIRDSVERCQDSSQRAINNIEAEILVPAGETEE